MAVKKSELYSTLWKCCDELRGGMDASQYKDYVLVILFVKYISDKKLNDEGFDIDIPKGCYFEDFVALKGNPNIGEEMNKKMAALAEENQLGGVFVADFEDDTKLGKGKDKVETLSKLIAVFQNENLDFSKNRAADDDLIGDAYEYLMKNFATESGKSKGQFYTPAEVSRVMAEVIGLGNAKNGRKTTIYDPTCGSGSLLLRAMCETPGGATLYGQEKDNATVGLAKMNMILHNEIYANIRQGDTINDPQFKEGDQLKTFDYIVANPPFSTKSWLKSAKYLLAELNYKRFMFKKLCILLIFSKLNEIKHLIDKYRMHNLYAIFAKLLNICKQIAGNLVNESGNVPRRGVVPKFSDLEVVALNMASEAVGIDSESLLFANLQEYRVEIPNLISRRQYNDRRKITSSLCNAIRERMVAKMDGGEDYFCIDSKPIEVCRIARSKRCSMGKKDFSKAPGVGYCASQSMYYYGYKLHAVCGLSGVIHSFDLTKASVHDIHYLKDVKVDYSNCTVIGDRGYISAQVQLDLFETANIRLEVPYRCNQKEWKPTFPAFAKARKRIETLFSQLCDQFMIIRNYAKDTDGLFARIIGKISALTILQYINYKNEKPIGRVKYALF